MNWCLVSAAVFVGSIAGGPQRSPLRFDEMHHAYIGAAACVIGRLTHQRIVLTIGQGLLIDDATQHLYQRMNGDLAIRSPVNIAYRFTLGRVPLVNKVGALIDAVLR